MSQRSGSGPARSWDEVMEEAESDHREWLRALEERIAQNGIQAEIQRYRDGGVSANEVLHCLIIAREFPAEFVSLACELVITRESSSVGREFLKKSGSPEAVRALRLLLGSDQVNHVYWALDALSGIRCPESIDAVRSFANLPEAPEPSPEPERQSERQSERQRERQRERQGACNFLEHQRQRALDQLEDNEKPYQERVKEGIRDAIRQQGAEAIVRQAADGTLPIDEVFSALRELREYSPGGLSLALEIGTDPKLDCHERRDPINFLCEYRGDGAEDTLFEALEAQLEIHFSGGDAWAEGCRLLDAIGAAGSEAALPRLEALNLARQGASNSSTVDLEEDRQSAMVALAERHGRTLGPR
jgi:hypothetical protein